MQIVISVCIFKCSCIKVDNIALSVEPSTRPFQYLHTFAINTKIENISEIKMFNIYINNSMPLCL